MTDKIKTEAEDLATWMELGRRLRARAPAHFANLLTELKAKAVRS